MNKTSWLVGLLGVGLAIWGIVSVSKSGKDDEIAEKLFDIFTKANKLLDIQVDSSDETKKKFTSGFKKLTEKEKTLCFLLVVGISKLDVDKNSKNEDYWKLRDHIDLEYGKNAIEKLLNKLSDILVFKYF